MKSDYITVIGTGAGLVSNSPIFLLLRPFWQAEKHLRDCWNFHHFKTVFLVLVEQHWKFLIEFWCSNAKLTHG
jgi:hypothetical protein